MEEYVIRVVSCVLDEGGKSRHLKGVIGPIIEEFVNDDDLSKLDTSEIFSINEMQRYVVQGTLLIVACSRVQTNSATLFIMLLMEAKMTMTTMYKIKIISSIVVESFLHTQVTCGFCGICFNSRMKRNFSFTYHAGKQLLKPTNLQFERNHRYGVVGNNGVGKTTLLNRIASREINGFPQDIKVLYIQHGKLTRGTL